MPSPILLLLISFLAASMDLSLGMGCGTTMSPLSIILGLDPIKVILAVLLSSTVGDIFSSFFHHYFRNVNFHIDIRSSRIALYLGGLGVLGGVGGALIPINIPENILSIYIGILVTLFGIFAYLSRRSDLKFSWLKITAIGINGNFNKGMSGGGFGPMITVGGLLAGIREKSSVAIQALSEFPVSAINFFIYLIATPNIDWFLTLAITGGANLATPIATPICKRN
jgi:hypothetical protein